MKFNSNLATAALGAVLAVSSATGRWLVASTAAAASAARMALPHSYTMAASVAPSAAVEVRHAQWRLRHASWLRPRSWLRQAAFGRFVA